MSISKTRDLRDEFEAVMSFGGLHDLLIRVNGEYIYAEIQVAWNMFCIGHAFGRLDPYVD